MYVKCIVISYYVMYTHKKKVIYANDRLCIYNLDMSQLTPCVAWDSFFLCFFFGVNYKNDILMCVDGIYTPKAI